MEESDEQAEGFSQEGTSKQAEEFEEVVSNCNFGDPPTVLDVISWYSSTGKVAERTVRIGLRNTDTKLISQSASGLSKRKTKKIR
ncbi:hypothetical protein P7H25_04480 [Paenibacillus larvae]|nr:hypothetical protein [Paenibacillus larvae]MDT2255047.1 hypothetical protein [Paenibacillus larvae]